MAISLHSPLSSGAQGNSNSTKDGGMSMTVVLQLPFFLNLTAMPCHLARIENARKALAKLDYNLVCFWWTNPDADVNSSEKVRSGLAHLRKACSRNLMIYHQDVLPHYRHVHNVTNPWWNADVPFILSAHQFKNEYFKGADVIWYLEWDVHWTGDLGVMLKK